MEVTRSIEISRGLDEVFAFVADARNDPRWCPKVSSTVQLLGNGPGPGARYAVVHRPLPQWPPREMTMECVGWAPPHRVEWHEIDGVDDVQVMYTLSENGDSTQLTQRSFLKQVMPQRPRPFMRHAMGHDIERQLVALKKVLEGPHG